MNLAYALEMAALTDIGLERDHNEDALFVDAERGLAILADGMGGYNAGEVAAEMLVSRLAENLGEREIASDEAPPGRMDIVQELETRIALAHEEI